MENIVIEINSNRILGACAQILCFSGQNYFHLQHQLEGGEVAAISQLLKRYFEAHLYHLSLDAKLASPFPHAIAHPNVNTALRSKAYGPKTA